ncbi:hypothetical protein MASR1M50_07710 [Burkholderiales bacterium]
MQHAPDVHVAGPLDMEHQIGRARERPGAQAGQAQLVRPPGRARGGLAAEVRIGALQRGDEAQRGFGRVLLQVVGDGIVHIAQRLLPRDDRLGRHERRRGWAAAPGARCTRWRSAVK